MNRLNMRRIADSNDPLLARGRDRLETFDHRTTRSPKAIPYSLGDAIDWKRPVRNRRLARRQCLPYSLGDAIDWKHFR